jgi:hypothetical protein
MPWRSDTEASMPIIICNASLVSCRVPAGQFRESSAHRLRYWARVGVRDMVVCLLRTAVAIDCAVMHVAYYNGSWEVRRVRAWLIRHHCAPLLAGHAHSSCGVLHRRFCLWRLHMLTEADFPAVVLRVFDRYGLKGTHTITALTLLFHRSPCNTKCFPKTQMLRLGSPTCITCSATIDLMGRRPVLHAHRPAGT